MSMPKTLLQMAGADQTANALSNSVVVTIDQQNEYLSGALALTGIDQAMAEAKAVLVRARAAGTPIIHIVHKGSAGGPFDLSAERGQIADQVSALAGEPLVEKTLPNSFAGTTLVTKLEDIGCTNLIITGFMTHLCVSATARVALDLGLRTTIVSGATATRDLPSATGQGVVKADTVAEATLAALADRFATIVPTAQDLPD